MTIKRLLEQIIKIFFAKRSLLFAIFLFSLSLIVIETIVSKKFVENKLEIAINSTERKINAFFLKSEHALLGIIDEFESKPYSINNLYLAIQRVRGVGYQYNKLPWTEFSWIDSRNNIIVDSKYGLISGKNKINLSNRDYVQKALKQPYKIQIGSMVIGSTSYKKMIPFGIGTARDGKYSGAITLGMEINRTKNIIKEIIPVDSSIIALGVNNEMLFSTNNDLITENRPLVRKLIAKSIKYRSKGRSLSSINFFKLENLNVAVKYSEKYPFTFIAIYQDIKDEKNLIPSHYVIKIKILILIVLSIILILLVTRFDKR